MIYALNLTCDRDWDLRTLMLETYTKQSGFSSWMSVNTQCECPEYGNGAGWEASMIKLSYIRKMLNNFPVKDDDFILSVDSDVVFTSPEVFKYIKPEYGIIGTRHQQPFPTMFGLWGHMSGALIFIRGDVAKRITALPESELNMIRQKHFKGFNLTENEDVVLSYLCQYVGANWFDLGSVPGLSSGDFESDIDDILDYQRIKKLPMPLMPEAANIRHRRLKEAKAHIRSFYHLNYCPKSFLGELVKGKWDIPRILKMKGIEL